jgi:alanine racemase
VKTNRRHFIQFLGLGPLALLRSGKTAVQEKKPTAASISSFPQPSLWIDLNLAFMEWNLSQLRHLLKAPIMAVIKANAYGHGLTEVGWYLETKGIDSLMVGNFQEAVQLRETGISCSIHHFGPISSVDPNWMVDKDVSQSVFTDEISVLNASALRLAKKTRVHIHIDTGMGRMGIPYYQAHPYIEKAAALPGIKIAGISTTLTEDPDFDLIQLQRLLEICDTWEKKGVSLGLRHAASSAASLDMPAAHLDMIRPGIILYGYYPSEKAQAEKKINLKPVLELKCRVAAVKELRPGDSVSYHRAYVAPNRQSIAVLPIGYTDGYPTTAVDRGGVLIGGEFHPLIAGITANHMQVLLSKGVQVKVGDEAVLIGRQGKSEISALDIARWTGQSVYKILLSLNPSLPRQIIAS